MSWTNGSQLHLLKWTRLFKTPLFVLTGVERKFSESLEDSDTIYISVRITIISTGRPELLKIGVFLKQCTSLMGLFRCRGFARHSAPLHQLAQTECLLKQLEHLFGHLSCGGYTFQMQSCYPWLMKRVVITEVLESCEIHQKNCEM